MSLLTQSTRINKMNAAWVADNVVAHRGGGAPGFTCRCCGGYTHSMADMANLLGISPNTVSNWLHKRPIRQDIAELLRRSMYRTDDE